LKRIYKLLSSKKNIVSNNKGFTLVELITTFALLGLFMVAAARIISYVVGIYYAARGSSYGLEVSNMISNKIVGQVENASMINSYKLDGEENYTKLPYIFDDYDNHDGMTFDRLKLVDGTGSVVTYSVDSTTGVLRIHYDQTANYDPDNDTGYAAVDWYFDEEAYMGYKISRFDFSKAGDEYPDNVIRLDLSVDSPKYGEFDSYYYIKCFNVDEVKVK